MSNSISPASAAAGTASTSLEEKIARLSPAKRALLEQRLGQKSLPDAGQEIHRQTITRLPDLACKPLSSAQQRLWFLHHWDPASPLYNSPLLLRLHGNLDLIALQQALDALAARHETLRTVFQSHESQPIQTVAAPCSVTLRPKNATIGQEDSVPAWVGEEARQPFDLAGGALLRAAWETVSENDHFLLLTVPHIVFDGWSQTVLLRDLAALYSAFAQKLPPLLPDLPIQYGDYAAWQQARLAGSEMQEHLSYWKEQLSGLPGALELASDRPRPAAQSHRGSRLRLEIPASLLRSLTRLGQSEGATLFMVLLAAFHTLLARYTGQTDSVIGAPIAGRSQAETEELIGCFINTLALRTDLSGAPTFRAALRRVRRTCLEAYAHQDLPFDRLVEELGPERDLSRSPLVQALLVLQNAPRRDAAFFGLDCQVVEVETRTAKFDLTLSLNMEGDGLAGWLEYSTDLFDASTIARLCGHFEMLLQGIAENPDQGIDELPLLTPPERRQILGAWSLGEEWDTSLPSNRCLHQLFEAQAAQTPNAVAVVGGESQITYAELNTRAEHLSRDLRRRGVGPDTLVGLCVERSPEMVVALLGILKAGGAYVPLDPNYPSERLAFMLADAEVSVLLTQERLRDKLPVSAAQIVYLDADGNPSTGSEEKTRRYEGSEAGPTNLAYVLYTSGSTGKPKGVAIEHRSAVALADWARRVFSPEDLAMTLASTSLCFDLSVFEIFVPLSLGGTVRVVENALALTASAEANDITLINTVPSAMTELLRTGSVPAGVRVVNLAGEPLPQKLAQEIYRQTAAVQSVFNLYGPSEDTTYSTFARVVPGAGEAPPIGRPICGTQAYVLDGCGNPVPAGVPGELYLAGRGLARGYWKRPELTAEKFVPCPFGAEPDARMYRTGDKARWLPDGALEYLGRLDYQVKLRGFRIELGEIEAVLASLPALRECAVMVREDTPGDPRLVAYLVLAAGERPEASDLRAFLKTRLPDYMIPAAFVFLDALPLTPNGKRNRQNLPPPERSHAASEKGYAAPRNSLEETLCGIWADVLKVECVDIHDSFFECGGHSLLAMQAISRVQAASGLRASLRLLFESPTPASFAAGLEGASGNAPVCEDCAEPPGQPELRQVAWRHLPAPERVAAAPKDTYRPPRSLLHASLQQIWEETLAVRPIGVSDNFFALGGHSLLAVRLLERMEQATGRRLPLALLFNGPTIEQVADALLREVEEPVAGMMAVRSGGSLPPLYFLHGDFHGGGLYSFPLARHLGSDQPVYALPPLGLNGEAVPPSLPEIAARHLADVRRFQPNGPYRLGGYCNGGLIAYEMARLLEAQGESVEALILIHASPGSIRYRPLRRVARSLGRRMGLQEPALHQWMETLRAARSPHLRPKKNGGDKAGAEINPLQKQQDELMNLYRMLIGYYAPGPYSGQISLFWPAEASADNSSPDRAWADFAERTEVFPVPGDHYSCILEHIEALSLSVGNRLAKIAANP